MARRRFCQRPLRIHGFCAATRQSCKEVQDFFPSRWIIAKADTGWKSPVASSNAKRSYEKEILTSRDRPPIRPLFPQNFKRCPVLLTSSVDQTTKPNSGDDRRLCRPEISDIPFTRRGAYAVARSMGNVRHPPVRYQKATLNLKPIAEPHQHIG